MRPCSMNSHCSVGSMEISTSNRDSSSTDSLEALVRARAPVLAFLSKGQVPALTLQDSQTLIPRQIQRLASLEILLPIPVPAHLGIRFPSSQPHSFTFWFWFLFCRLGKYCFQNFEGCTTDPPLSNLFASARFANSLSAVTKCILQENVTDVQTYRSSEEPCRKNASCKSILKQP